jgi:DNA-binding transcriptional ArsR family regulator
MVNADDNGGKSNDGNGNEGNSNGVNGNEGNSNRDNRNGVDVGRGNSTDGRGNEMNPVNKEANDQKNTSDASNKTAVVQHIVSTPTVQAPVVVLLVTYSAGAASSVSGAWWEPEGLFRKFFFLFGSIGEKIRRKDVLRNRKRREIYYFVVNNPFSHFRRITRMVRVGPNQCSWHLRILEKMGLIKSEHVGRYLTYHANNSDYTSNRGNRPATLISNSNATKILEYLLRNPGVKIAHLSQALMMNRHTISYHIKRMQTSGLVERVERNGLRLSPIAENHGERLTHLIASPVA